MPEIKFNITQAKLTRLINATKGNHHIPQIENPDYVPDPLLPDKPPDKIDEFTPQEWVKIYWKRTMAREVQIWEQFLAKKAIQLDEILT